MQEPVLQLNRKMLVTWIEYKAALQLMYVMMKKQPHISMQTVILRNPVVSG